MIYFDNSATAPVDREVLEAMLPYLREEYGNPSSKYYGKAVHAHNAVEEARAAVAGLLGAKPEEIVFTAGATESTNFYYQRIYGLPSVLWGREKSCDYICGRTQSHIKYM